MDKKGYLLPEDIRHVRRQLRLTQAQLAHRLGVSPVTVARWESGQRACQSGFASKIKQLELEHTHKAVRAVTTILSITRDDLSRLDSQGAVEVFRDLLWCQARRQGVPISSVHITLQEIADGGIDASVDEPALTEFDELLSGRPSYQIKAGANAKPWQNSWLRKEFFGGSRAAVDRANLGAAVLRCLENQGRYVLVCFGCSPTPEQIAQAREKIEEYFTACGFVRPRVEVWGQEHLIGLISNYPSLCLKIAGRDFPEFRSYTSWTMSSEMSLPLHLGEDQERLIKEIRTCIRGDTVRHVRVIGEPGLGKTRLVLQAMSVEDLAPQVVYVPHAEDFQRCQLFNTLLRSDNDYFVILVIDECSVKERASIWDAMRRRSDRCRLITIDHGPEDIRDSMMRVFDCPPLSDEQIAAIIDEYVPLPRESRRWAKFCGGSPRVAHAVGRNLQENPDDILKSPATVPIWDRFVAGYDNIDSASTRDRLLVLRYIALFQRFGFELPVHEEARFICELAQQANPDLTWPRFQSIVHDLKERRILQGKTTLFIAPKALHVYLWLQFWERHGRGFAMHEILPRLPVGLCGWFIRMFPYAHASDVAQRQVEALLGPSGLFADDSFAESQIGCEFLNVLAEAAPGATLRCIERTIGTWDRERLLRFKDARQQIVWALEKIAIWPPFFCRAAKVLLKLGAVENSRYGNNASGTFAGLFNPAPGAYAPTGASPTERLPALRAALESNIWEERQLGLRACESALSTYSGGRTIGAEYQGLRPTAKLWTPETWGEVFNAYSLVWQLVTEVSSTWQDEERAEANNVLIEAAADLICIEPIADMVFATLHALLDDPTTNLNKFVEFVTGALGLRRDELGETLISQLEALDKKITGTSFRTRLRRVVLLSTWEDEFDDEGKPRDDFQERITALVMETLDTSTLLDSVLADLVTGTSNSIFNFGLQLGKLDHKRVFLKKIIKSYCENRASATALFLGGYLAAVFNSSVDEWESILEQLLVDNGFTAMIGPLIGHSGLTNSIFKKILVKVDAERLPISTFLAFCHMRQLRKIKKQNIESLLKRLILSQQIGYGLKIVHYVYCNKDSKRKLPEELTFELLFSEESPHDRRNPMTSYYWSGITKQFLAQYPGRYRDVFQASLGKLFRQRWYLDAHNRSYKVVLKIIQNDPEACWPIVTSMLGDLRGETAYWLDLPLALFPIESVLSWVAEDPETRAPFIARAVPKTLSPNASGVLTRELLDHYGNIEKVRHALFSHFLTDSWSGPASGHYRRKRDEARSWLENETSARVIAWVEEYIELLGREIEQAEIEEERRF